MTREEFLTRVTEQAGTTEEAERSTRAVLGVLGERLSRLEADALAAELPEELGELLRGEKHGQAFDLDELTARLAQRTGAREGLAIEQAMIVCRVIAEAVGEDVVSRLRRELPATIAALLTLPARIAKARSEHVRPSRRTLAEGRPGSERPLYAASADRAQSHSVARAANPHGDTKLSSSRGITQEREAETLAEGQPGSERPLSDAE